MASRYSTPMWVYLNERFVEHSEAMVPIDDRGFRYGDGIFETIQVSGGVPLFFERHIQRLEEGIEAIRMTSPELSWAGICRDILHKNKLRQGILRIAVSRGCGGRGYAPAIEAQTPTVVIEMLPLPEIPTNPLSVYMSSYQKISPRALPVEHKLAQGLSSTLAAIEAREQDCDDALMLNQAGQICEFTASNLFWRRGKQIYTPALECGLLNGITRQLLCEQWQDKLTIGSFTLPDLLKAEEVIAVNRAMGARAIASLQKPAAQWNSNRFAEETNAVMTSLSEQYIAEQEAQWR